MRQNASFRFLRSVEISRSLGPPNFVFGEIFGPPTTPTATTFAKRAWRSRIADKLNLRYASEYIAPTTFNRTLIRSSIVTHNVQTMFMYHTDIAVAESTSSSCITEFMNGEDHRTRAQARHNLVEYIEALFNRRRRHAA